VGAKEEANESADLFDTYGMSGWERLSAEGRSKRQMIWSPGLPI